MFPFRTSLVFLFVWMTGFTCLGDERHIDVEHLGMDEGLPVGKIFDLHIDHSGFLWIASWNGLSRFDGHRFVHFPFDPDVGNKIPQHGCTSIAPIDSVNFVINYVGNVGIINSQTGEFTRSHFEPLNGSLGESAWQENIIEIIKHNGKIYIVTSKGLFEFNTNTLKRNTTLLWEECPLELYDRSMAFCIRQKNVLQLHSHNGGIFAYNLDSRAFTFEARKSNHIISSAYKQAIAIDESRSLFSVKNDILLLEKDGSYKKLDWLPSIIKKTLINEFFQVGDQKFVGASNLGNWELDFRTKKTRKWVFFENGNKINVRITSYLKDSNGTEWFGSSQGLWRSTTTRKFRHILSNLSNENGLQHPSIFSIFIDDDSKVWLGSDMGIDYWYNGKITRNPLELSNSYRVRSLLMTDSKAFIGSIEDGLLVCDLNSDPTEVKQLVSQYGGDKNYARSRQLKMHKGRIVTASTGGLISLNPNSLEDARIEFENLGFMLYGFLYDNDGNIWLATKSDGLYRMHPDREIVNYLPYPEIKNSLTNMGTSVARLDQNVWMGTFGGGLMKLNINNDKITTYTTFDGLANNVVYGILPDGKGRLWMSTDYGISVFYPETEHFHNFDEVDGLKVVNFNSGAYTQKDGWMYFGGYGGVIYFHPDSILRDSRNLRVKTRITRVTSSESTKNLVAANDTIQLSGDRNFFSAEFARLDLVSTSKTLYRYKLKDFDEHWRYTSFDERFASYINLPQGNYKFKVQSKQGNTDWKQSQTHLVINVLGPWWKSTPAKVMGVVFLFFLAWWLYHRRIQRLNRQKAAEVAYWQSAHNSSSLEALRHQVNPHFLFNALNSINAFIFSQNKEAANKYLVRFGNFIRSVLNQTQEELIPLETEINILKNYIELEQMRMPDQFKYQIDIDEQLDLNEVKIPSMFIQPLAENAIWHGLRKSTDGLLLISFKKVNDRLISSVSDNGIGINNARKERKKDRPSFGINLIRKRINILSKLKNCFMELTIVDRSSQGEKGTEATINTPLKI